MPKIKNIPKKIYKIFQINLISNVFTKLQINELINSSLLSTPKIK
jgi:hypothetical protein